MPTLQHIRIKALKCLHRKGFHHIGFRRCSNTKIEYDLFEDQQKSPIKIKILCRSYKSIHRYPIGLRPEALNIIDYYVFYFDNEPCYYLTPVKFLRDIYACLEKPSINVQGQWFCNITMQYHLFETKEQREHARLGQYKISSSEDQ